MILSALLLVAPRWFGPITVDQALPTVGNPFDPVENDVRCVFTKGSRRLERLAYFAKGQWHSTLAAGEGGTYNARFVVNGRPAGETVKVRLTTAKDGEFVQLAKRRFRLTSGKPFVPFGHNFGWQGTNDKPYPVQLADMAKAGLNWTRVWSNGWDGKNPYVPPSDDVKLPIGRFYEPALDRWDMVIQNCEKNAIKLQFVFFHHGLFSTTTDANWNQHPWNKANGGFLADPTDFFVHPKAKELTKAWLRYGVARWGHSTAIMAWELFNEVQWVDAAKLHSERIGDVVAWHREMGDYLRSIDSYRHLVTSSSNENLDPRVFATMDYEQPHTYPPSIYGALLGVPVPKDRPVFFGEFGRGNGFGPGLQPDLEKAAVRDGFWGGLLAGHAGPGAYWFWDRVYPANLYTEYAREAKVLARSGFAQNPDAMPAPITVTGGVAGDLTLRPGRGWAKTEKSVYDLPQDAAMGALPLLSGYIQGAKGANRATMMPEPLRFRFNAKSAGEARIRVGQVAKTGGALAISVNGRPVLSKEYGASERDTRIDEILAVPFAAGANEIVIDNPGPDWVTIDSLTLSGVGAGVSAVSLRSDDYALARLRWTKEFGPSRKAILMPGMRDGTYELRQFDIDNDREKVTRVKVNKGLLSGYVPFALDEGIALFRK